MKKNASTLFKSAFSSLLLLLLIACGGSSAPVIVNFRVSQSTVAPGSEVTLTWEVTQADRVTLTSNVSNKTEDIRASGSRREVITSTTTFTLTAYNGRRSTAGTITVTVSDVGEAPIISSFTATPDVITAGAEVTLSWSVSGADSLNISGIGDVTGQTSQTVTVDGPTVFTLTATNAFGSATREVAVTTGQPVISTFNASSSSVTPGTAVTLSWQVTAPQAHPAALTLSPDVGAVSGNSVIVTPNQSTTYTLTATNVFGSDSAQVTVTVGNAPSIGSFSASRSSVSFGEPVTLSWSTSNATSVTITPSSGGTLATSGTLMVNPTARTTYRLVATNSFASVERELTIDVWLTFMIAGQSNAVGWHPINAAGVTVEQNTSNTMMFANDDSWKLASEPVDSNLGQNSSHGGYDNFSAVTGISGQDAPGHSFGVALGNRLQSGTQAGRFRVALLPTAKGGSNVFASSSSGWRPNATDVRNRTTVFGDALVRAELLEADQNLRLTAILWYQGEADSSGNCGNCNGYIANTKRVFIRLNSELRFTTEGRNIPIIYAQLSHFGDDLSNSETVNNQRHKGWQDIREKQRLMEAGAYNPISGTTSLCAVPHMHMVVTHDLAMFDRSHLTAESQKILGDRINRAVREHILGENIDGTGPRLAGISKSGNVIRISTTRTINNSSTYGNYFTVFDAAGNEVPITSMGRDESRRTDVLLTLASDPGEGYTVRYMPPRDPTGGVPMNNLTDVIRDPSTGLPLPAFGRMVEFASTLDPDFPNSELAGQCTTYDIR
jgi:uncharacterized cupredoxin-like copper-binding protein